MKRLLFKLGFICLQLSSFAQENATVTTNEIPFTGNYKGKAPCADCDIIEVELELQYGTDSSGEYSLREKYISKKGTNIMSRMKGEWMVVREVTDNRSITYVALDFDNPEKIKYYFRKQNGSLLLVDDAKKKIETPIDCTLVRTP